jgi:ketosteroid isomerase-like protein
MLRSLTAARPRTARQSRSRGERGPSIRSTKWCSRTVGSRCSSCWRPSRRLTRRLRVARPRSCGALRDRADRRADPTATRQLASRGRRRVQGADADASGGTDVVRQRAIVDAFLAASRGGDFDALLSLLDPDVVLRADRAGVEMGADEEVLGAAAVAETFAGRARVARPALVDGAVGLVWAQGGQPRVVFALTIAADKIAAIELVADPERIRALDLTIFDE